MAVNKKRKKRFGWKLITGIIVIFLAIGFVSSKKRRQEGTADQDHEASNRKGDRADHGNR